MAVQERELEAVDTVVPLRRGEGAGPDPETPPEAAAEALPLFQTALAAGLATAAAAWMVGGVFSGWEPRVIGVAVAFAGAALSYAIYRFGRPSLQFFVPLFGLVVGAMLLAPDAHAGTSSLPGLVVDALRTGGFLQPPVDFAPGWRLILAALFTILAAGALGVAIATGRPRLAPIVPMPLALGAALVQPAGTALISSAVTIVAALAAFAVSYGADLGQGMGASREMGAAFEIRRLGRTAAMVAGLVVAVVIFNQAGFLFPSPDQNRVVPPQRPQVPPQVPDVPLFRVTTNAQTPYRLGVIDIYDSKQNAWLLPPQDSRRLVRKSTPAALPGPALGAQTLTATFVVLQATGHLLPDIGGTVRVTGMSGQQFDYDPRQGTLRMAGKPVFTGLTYTVVAPLPVPGDDLRKAGPEPASMGEFLAAPPAPLEVQQILDHAPHTNLFDRLQYVRQALYDKVVAAGAGKPVDVSPARAVQVLEGKDASPYEITATEALLARWAGIPARIGYGYYGGEKQADGSFEIRPGNGATWLEVYFSGYGWIPVVGTPPRAKASSSNSQKNPNPSIHAVDEFALVVYLPAKVDSLLPLYVILRYWLLVALPFVLAAVAAIVFFPGVVKALRSRRRRRWAAAAGPSARIAVAYVEFRDTARDLAIGDPLATPLEFLDYIDPDKEHRELAWLVTRALYGDVRHELTGEHALLAERMARSVSSRVTRGQPLSTKLLAFAARTSLREPYSTEVPNLWPSGRRPARPARLVPAVAAALAGLVALGACASSKPLAARPLPTRIAPARLGALALVEEPKAEAIYAKARRDGHIIVSEGRVFSIHQGGITEGAIEVARFKPGYTGTDPQVVQAIEDSIGRFQRFRRTRVSAWINQTGDQRIYLWFAPGSDSMTLLILRHAFTAANADAVARALIGYEAGLNVPATLSLGADQQ